MKTKIYLLTVSLLSLLFFTSKAQTTTAPTPQLSQYENFIAEMKAKGIPTGNILVYENEKVVFKSSDGLRSIDPMTPLTMDSQFRLASVSKQFTGMAVMKLKEAGKLDYDQKVNSILTDFPYDNITVKHLLQHLSGLADYVRIVDTEFAPKDKEKQPILGNDEILELFYRIHPDLVFQPGEKWEYSNTGYLVLASIVEKVSGQHFREFLKANVFDPIGMTNTTLYKYQIDPDPNMPNRVFGYRLAFNQKDKILNDYNIVNDVRGDGGIYSTINDLYKWNLALANYTIIPKKYLDEAWAPGTLNNGEKTGYGFGWGLSDDESSPNTVMHSGGWVGFGTYLHNEYETKSGYVILTNNSSRTFGTVIGAINNIRSNKPYKSPKWNLTDKMANLISSKNVEAAIDLYQEKKNDTGNYNISEDQINELGYGLLYENKVDDALAIFKLNIQEHPKSANPYDSYGDALLMTGDSLQALENFKICYKMDNSLDYAKDKAEKLEAELKK